MTAPSRSRRTQLLGWSVAGIILPFVVWAAAARSLDIALALPGPIVVARRVASVIVAPGFLATVGATVLRAVVAALITTVVAVPTGLASARVPAVARLVGPTVVAMRTIPFISLILVAVIWLPSATVPLFVALLMALPIVHEATAGAVSGVDRRLEEMVRVFAMPRWSRVVHLWLPGAARGIWSGLRAAFGIIWKVTVAAEVLGRPARGIGSAMAEGRLFLETDTVLAWTVVLVVVAGAADALVRVLERVATSEWARRQAGNGDGTLARRHAGGRAPAAGYGAEAARGAPAGLHLHDLSVRWTGLAPLFDRFTLSVAESHVVALMGPSGTGKTTLLRVAAGLGPGLGEAEWSAMITRPSGRVAYVFQEPRLLPWRTASANVVLAARCTRADAMAALHVVGLAGVADAFPDALSGGMQERLALARAIAAAPALLLIDEPLTGVDPSQRAEIIDALRAAIDAAGVTTLIATHDAEITAAGATRVVVLTGRPARVAGEWSRDQKSAWTDHDLQLIQSSVANGRKMPSSD